MRLDYGTILCPEPITLSIGTLRNPTLREIAKLQFEKFGYYEFLIKMSPETFYTKVKNGGEEYWESLTKKEKEELTLYDIIIEEETLANLFLEVFNFFFVESVIFKEGYFILLKENIEDEKEIDENNIQGVIARENLEQVLELIQQICCIYEKKEEVKNIKFKNSLAKNLYGKILNANKKNEEKKKSDINLTLPNIISSVSNKHPTLSPLNIWDCTVFQLLDAFNRTQINTIYDIDSTRVSVWGDEKKTFDVSLWYKNEYDKKL